MAWMTRDQQLQKKYSITEEIYEKILKAQNNRCGICNCQQHYQRLAVDHDHKTGQVRGLLCVQCNRGLGRFFDSELRLRNAADYIARAQKAWNEVVLKCQPQELSAKSKILSENTSPGPNFPLAS